MFSIEQRPVLSLSLSLRFRIVGRFTEDLSRFPGTGGKEQPGPRDHRLPVRGASDPQRGGGRRGRSRRPPRLPLHPVGVPRVQRPLRARQVAVSLDPGPRLLDPGHPRQGNGDILAGSLSSLGIVPRRVESKGKDAVNYPSINICSDPFHLNLSFVDRAKVRFYGIGAYSPVSLKLTFREGVIPPPRPLRILTTENGPVYR